MDYKLTMLLVFSVFLGLLALGTNVSAEEDAYIQFPDGNLVENPFNANFFEPETDPLIKQPLIKQRIPLGFANPRQSISALVDESDPAGLGTSCNLYQGEIDLVKTLKERYGLSDDEAMRCLDRMNVSGGIIANQFAEKEQIITEDFYIDNIDNMDISNGEKLKYKRVVRDTIRAIRTGKVKVNAYNDSMKEEEGRTQLFVGIISDCVHSYMK